jgi:general stress protein 26
MIAFEGVEKALRQRTFGTLSTLTEQGAPHATGVVYAVSARDVPLILYVTTRTTTRKVRNIRTHADIAFVVPVPRRWAGRNVASTAQMTRQRDGAHDRDAARCGGLVVL